MGRQWLQKHREINAARRARINTKLLREVSMAAKSGVPDPTLNPRLAVAVEAAHKQSVPGDRITRAIKKGAGLLEEKLELEHVLFEGFAPHRVPVMVECLTDNRNRTAPEIRVLFRKGQLGVRVSFLFDHVGIVEATHPDRSLDLETVAIEAGAQNVEPLAPAPEEGTGGRFLTEPADLDAVTKAIVNAGFTVTVSEMGYVPKQPMDLPAEARQEVEEFLEALDDNEDVHRIHTALR
ncbi:MAG: YebC/PmpR family DNA-binding transcriptional regulator [Planctomycetes bacterium]|jgi:YebC/PmpR family DNA-binding regulatory protein|nr:YebC/PmpR family DNA-binding transcriptional regulator [Planctomycetota bacterium]